MNMFVDENKIKQISKTVLNEYLDKDYMNPLKKYMHMDEGDKALECACRLPWLFVDYVKNDHEVSEIINDKISDGEIPEDVFQWENWEAAEEIGPLFKTDLNDYCEDFIEYCSNSGNTEVPLFCVADFTGEIHNEWLIHMTDSSNIPGLYKEGFSYGVDIDQLAYTPARGGIEYKYGAGCNFAFEVKDAYTAENSGYGDCAVLFQASGIKIYHWGDDQGQVIFYGPSARNLIFIFRDDETGEWYVQSELTDRKLVEFDDLEDIVQWCINNFDQYRNHLIGRSSQPMKYDRNIQKRKEDSQNKVSEGISSKHINCKPYTSMNRVVNLNENMLTRIVRESVRDVLNEGVDSAGKVQALVDSANAAYKESVEACGDSMALMGRNGLSYGLMGPVVLRRGRVVINYDDVYGNHMDIDAKVLERRNGRVVLFNGDFYDEGWKDVKRHLETIINDAERQRKHDKYYDPNNEEADSPEELETKRKSMRDTNKLIGLRAGTGVSDIRKNY